MPRYTTSRRSSSGSTHQHQHHNHNQSSTSSSPRSSQSQRPRLLRSSATTPAITAPSSEIQGSVISPNSPHTAAEMLNRMAPSHYHQREETGRYLQPRYHQQQAVDIERERSGSAESFASTPGNSLDDGYFSFPEFDGWEREEDGYGLKQEGE